MIPNQREILEDETSSRPLRDRSTVETLVSRFKGDEAHTAKDVLAVEEPLEIQLGYGPADSRRTKSISVTMRTPGHDFELVAGFLLTEGVVSDYADIGEISYVAGRASDLRSEEPSLSEDLILPYQPERNVVRVDLAPDVSVSLANLERNFYTTSSCGICGKASLLALRTVCPPRYLNRFQVSAHVLCSLPDKLRAAQEVFDRTGGLHASGMFDAEGHLHSIREDVGRHNAVDKLLGAEFLADRTPVHDRLLFLSGRASFELLQKALMGGIPMVVSVGAPSSLAVQVAKEFDMTLVGFLRGDHFNVYQGAERIVGDFGVKENL
ncbi:formate dehydrogenase accessory sulfurtransferase FdhD [Granulicella sp. dw_53]|uniref:formate dehydrogenase accessory sulfurtransferase FdhD n=1 Tax=Granulicella sp. dw_53 TaxID=2719792 RepID=UPI0021056191|nr:formate dehydrogenase accessory sulfurtransferase FdhD [Granulicella sp. dw_53]